MKFNIWLSYDLGIRGDYDGMYYWLDRHKAKECGDSVAIFIWETNDVSEIPHTIAESLRQSVTFGKKDRVYLTFPKINATNQLIYTGRYILGNRKASPWEGYAAETVEDDDVEVS